MTLSVILYGQQRTLIYCLPSIKRLFKTLLNCDFYVIINENMSGKNSYKNILPSKKLYELIIKELDPIDIEFCNITHNYFNQEKNHLYNDFEIKNLKFYKMKFKDYAKLPVKKKLYTIDELKKRNIKLEENVNAKNINLYWIEPYLKYKGYMNMCKYNNNYSHTFILRTDIIWFDNYKTKKIIFKNNTHGIPSVSNINILNDVKNYNKNILPHLDFKNLINSLNNIISINKESITSAEFFNKTYNIFFSNCHARLYRKDDLNDMMSIMNNKKKTLIEYSKYPILYPNWNGEILQMVRNSVINIKFNNIFYFFPYYGILRL